MMTDLYPTRTRDPEARIIDRPDPVVYGTGEKELEFCLPQGEVEVYRKDGFLIFPGLFGKEEVELFRSELERLERDETVRSREEVVIEPDSDRLRSIFSPHRFSAVFDALSRDARILHKAVQLLGSDVYLHQSRINVKPAYHGRSFPWHSDFETWHAEDGIPRCRMLTGWVMLTDNTSFNGPLYLISGSHEKFVSCPGVTPKGNYRHSLRKQAYGTPGEEAVRKLTETRKLQAATGPAGTLVLHEGNVMHGSPDNISPWPRTNVFFVYNSVENRPAEAPFAAPVARPDFLGLKEFDPLVPLENDFKHWKEANI
jgi:ectoine hydroxylase